ncbi:COG4223 family protein [Mangrovicella endophytica]|uniref:COG4223 family protein n=1 Tax=Mangrovicella endophytica TaxID=2066697 RepID=UPI0013000CF0|nr:hypothetical protein [Mangrovicella endophytica]
MANRPRHSRPNKPTTTIDLDAERKPAAAKSAGSAAAGAGASDVGLSPGEADLATGPEGVDPSVETSGSPDQPTDVVAAERADAAIAAGAGAIEPVDEAAAAKPLADAGNVNAGEEGAQTAAAWSSDDTRTPGTAASDERTSDAGFEADLTSETPPSGQTPGASVDERDAAAIFAADEGLDPSALRDADHGGARSAADDLALSAASPDVPDVPDYHPTFPKRGTAPVEDVPPAREPSSGTSFGTAFAAAILGAVIALAGGALLQSYGALPALGTRTVAEGEPQTFAGRGELQQVSGDLQTLRGQVEQLRSAQAAGGAGDGATTADVTALADRLTALEKAGSGAAAGGAAALSATQGLADRAQGSATAAQSTADQAAAAAKGAQDSANAAQQAAGAAQQTAQQAQEAARGAQGTADEAGRAAQAAQGSADAAKAAADTATQTATAAQQSAAQSAEAIASVEARIAAVEEANRQASVALAAAGLKSAVDRGGPFMNQLETYAAAAQSQDTVAALRDYAAEGIPSRDALLDRWASVEDAVRAALAPAPSTAPVGEQVLSGLRSLVQVRPAGTAAPGAAPGPDAAVNHMDTAIKRGDYAAFLKEQAALPEAGKAASADFAADVKAREAADRVVDEAVAGALRPAPAANGTEG